MKATWVSGTDMFVERQEWGGGLIPHNVFFLLLGGFVGDSGANFTEGWGRGFLFHAL